MQLTKSLNIFMLCSSLQAITQAVTSQNAENAYLALQQWYNQSTGLWIPSTGWWNSANCLTVIAHLAEIDPWVRREAKYIWHNTFVQAQEYNLQMQKVVDPGYLPCSYYTDNNRPSLTHGVPMPQARPTNGFLNDYYDDEGWWALAWLAVYDLTSVQAYLDMAESIFADMDEAYGTTPCGGLWWDKDHTYVNAIANELYIEVAARLANRSQMQQRRRHYLLRAEEAWRWFWESGMINARWNINDGLDGETCENNNGTVWTYDQGVIIGALTELSNATRNIAYIDTAKLIVDAGIANLTNSNDILHEPCEPDCGADGSQFKGIFARNLRILQKASPEKRYAEFLDRNADSLWENGRNGKNEFGLDWYGPFVGPANASLQSSGLDAVVAALGT